ncbi:GTP pyrophosphokinase [Urinicoccus massiliensis]|uniref:GTP diphosphokinase n=1 Tax=Urinicoccus massiliensis TaxID=1723382 RepID=A0A8H2MER8_9FIRM|nr:bifunctional (p)ppGpp synthetase/guanosine-3',5'-bis(diphosphate) 3'-pyrophosphohydrolase [Urinicoccus massiliensis]VFB16325.1 GTP pyrophosphokinase [Urinicoccus massiliensis]
MLETLLEKIKSYNPNIDEAFIRKGFEFAEEKHRGQKRNSGEDYIIHPYHVALILAEMNMDPATIVAGLLHDVVEDTDVAYEDVRELFGEEVANLVDGVTKLKKLSYQTKQEKQAENIRKMVLAMAKDIRVIIVKLADRLHNLRTLEYMNEAKKKEKALETIEIYAPLADRLGMSRIKWELEDLSLRYLDPDNYYKLVDMVNKRRTERMDFINRMIDRLQIALIDVNIKADIHGRPKNFYSIYKKMHFKGRAFDEIYDLSAIRVLVESINDCYAVLGVVHTLFKPIPGRFKDYIAMPKPNKYQSLHTTVMDDQGETFEVQIRTYDMHRTAEYGIAAHWKYKEGVNKATSFDENLTWLRQLLEWQKDVNDPNDFMETLKIDFLADEVYVFTPNGDVINLPEGSTPIDFAYRVHTGVGNTCMGAKINGRIVPLHYHLKNGDIVEIITGSNAEPSLDWLNIVKSSQAKSKIRQYFKVKDRDKNIERGRESLEREAKKLGYRVGDILRDDWLNEALDKLKIPNLEDMYAAVGYGSVTINQVMAKLVDLYHKEHKEPIDLSSLNLSEGKALNKKLKNNSGVIVKGLDNAKIRFAKCCNPVPGDDIIGYVTMGRGVSIHRMDCLNIAQNDDKSRYLEVKWDTGENGQYTAQIEIQAMDKSTVIGDVANRINDSRLNLVSLTAKNTKDHILFINVKVELHNIDELDLLIKRLKKLKSIYNAYRVGS